MISAWILGLALGTVPVPAQSGAPDVVTATRVAGPEKALRFEVIVPASLDDTWNALATTEGLATWLWRDTRVELKPGGDWLALYPGGKSGGGTIESFEPKRRLTLAAMAPEQFPTVRRERTRAVFELEAVAPSQTRVTLVQTGWKEGPEWDEAYDYLAKGNAILFRQLYRRFHDGPVDWSKMK